jgi:hypothetical protein
MKSWSQGASQRKRKWTMTGLGGWAATRGKWWQYLNVLVGCWTVAFLTVACRLCSHLRCIQIGSSRTCAWALAASHPYSYSMGLFVVAAHSAASCKSLLLGICVLDCEPIAAPSRCIWAPQGKRCCEAHTTREG